MAFVELSEGRANGEKRFSSEENKVQYLEELLSVFQSSEKRIASCNDINYSFLISAAENQKLYDGGCYGIVGKQSLFSSIAQDLIVVQKIIKVDDKGFDKKLFDYINHLHGLGFIPNPKVKVDYENPERLVKAASELDFSVATAPMQFVDQISENVTKLYMPKIEKIPDYDPNHIRSSLSLLVKN